MNETSNEELTREDGDIVDRLFPDVRLSTISFGQVRDTRDSPFDPTRGGTFGIDAELALRAIGSQVGFAKTFLQGFIYRTVAGISRLVFAGGGRLGMAWKFPHYRARQRRRPVDGGAADRSGAADQRAVLRRRRHQCARDSRSTVWASRSTARGAP